MTACSVPGTIGTLNSLASALASVLSPNRWITLDGGPTNEMPACSHSFTKWVFCVPVWPNGRVTSSKVA